MHMCHPVLRATYPLSRKPAFIGNQQSYCVYMQQSISVSASTFGYKCFHSCSVAAAGARCLIPMHSRTIFYSTQTAPLHVPWKHFSESGGNTLNVGRRANWLSPQTHWVTLLFVLDHHAFTPSMWRFGACDSSLQARARDVQTFITWSRCFYLQF